MVLPYRGKKKHYTMKAEDDHVNASQVRPFINTPICVVTFRVNLQN